MRSSLYALDHAADSSETAHRHACSTRFACIRCMPGGAGRSDLRVAPEAPAWFGRADGDRCLARDGNPRAAANPDTDLSPAASSGPLGRRLDLDRCRAYLDELEPSNRGSIVVRVGGRRRKPSDRRRWELHRGNGGLPASPDLVAPEWPSLSIEPAVTELRGDGSAEVSTGGASGAGPSADPAPGRLGLGCPAMRTAPHGHGRMVAANRAVVDPSDSFLWTASLPLSHRGPAVIWPSGA